MGRVKPRRIKWSKSVPVAQRARPLALWQLVPVEADGTPEPGGGGLSALEYCCGICNHAVVLDAWTFERTALFQLGVCPSCAIEVAATAGADAAKLVSADGVADRLRQELAARCDSEP